MTALALDNPARRRPFRYDIATWFSTMHVIGIVGPVCYDVWIGYTWWSALTILFTIAYFLAIQHATSLGPHRGYAHKTYEAAKKVEWTITLLSSAAQQVISIVWSGLHRIHHGKSDTAGDPYTVRHGWMWAHLWWMLFMDRRIPRNELLEHPVLRWQQRHNAWLAPAMSLGVPTLVCSLWLHPLEGLIIGGFTRLVFQSHLTWIVNSVSHSYGEKKYGGPSTARTIRGVIGAILGILTAGEANNHERHHYAPDDYRLGADPGDIDSGKWLLEWLARRGLVWNLKAVSEEEVRARVTREIKKLAQTPGTAAASA